MKKIAIDVGSRRIRSALIGENFVPTEELPVTAVTPDGKLPACGEEAVMMDMAAPGAVSLQKLFPDDGSLPDARQAVRLLSEILRRHHAKGANVYLALSESCDEEAERLFVDAAQRAGARDVFAVNAAYAAYLGCDVRGNAEAMLLHIGCRTLSMTAYSRGKEIASSRCEFAGDAFDQAIRSHILKRYHLAISAQEAERLKLEIGGMLPSGKESAEARVIRPTLGLPKKLSITAEELSAAMEPVFDELADAVTALIRKLPCEPDKLILTGGGAQLRSLAPALAPLVCVNVEVAPEPAFAVLRGLSVIAESKQR